MIFVSLGSQKFQFNRLLKELDTLIVNKIITETVIAQIGHSDYIPQNYKYFTFLNRDSIQNYIEKSNLVIAHGGTGILVSALKKNKKIIAIPRLSKYGEHVDDHQEQVISQFHETNLLYGINEIQKLGNAIINIKSMQFLNFESESEKIINSIDAYIKQCFH